MKQKIIKDEFWIELWNDIKKDLYTIPNEFIDKCPRCLYKFEYKVPLVKKCYCGSCSADITEFYIRISFNNLSREEAIKIYEGKIKYSKKEIESIKNNIETKNKKIE